MLLSLFVIFDIMHFLRFANKFAESTFKFEGVIHDYQSNMPNLCQRLSGW